MTLIEWLIIAVVVVAVIALVLALVDNELLVELAGELLD
ncbi:hypothetical protein C452_10386 [Haloferax volcanii JCM 10717]|jgi:type IV secretory pathway VirB6-like protein|uniref:Uncharacterized protein n=4 Tax=Haloferax volcanii TaxID=2246 RepID=D4GYP5_HALVD|nr:uncharacterized protein HVO_0050 [Haloferax volcanii DS2]ELK54054.1 hypothetical protein D320_11685 [Haloferax sp. BAB-2207]ELZ57584.1 hypothetical protein C460_12242 [Haloferax sp. ATCC BAA-646]ELZ62553.1 hypothetical protein C459_13619 [Haloferax sp. ATCC BAA-645]ELZ64975.1 hypothetical protein C458_14056 [Haloferax sp. ATCC BAA-644]ELZ70288.1 hypothetical protein C456_17797 [Haloferax lucentense DSM 14919]ELZ90812.1 hypothetical protein C452_10386 [Haloferax alexandrinus JCM 10717]